VTFLVTFASPSFKKDFAFNKPWSGKMRIVKSSLLALTLALISFITLSAQPTPPDTLWTAGCFNCARHISNTSDGGYIVSGYNSDQLFSWYWLYSFSLRKYDAAGNIIWSVSYGEPYVIEGKVRRAFETYSGNFYVVGYREIYYPSESGVFLFSSSGDSLSFIIHPSTYLYAARPTADSCFIITGVYYQSGSAEDVYVSKTDETGAPIWSRTYNIGESDYGVDIAQCTDGGYIVVTNKYYSAYFEMVSLLKLDADGDSLWLEDVNLKPENTPSNCLQPTNDNGFIISSTANQFYDAFLFKLDEQCSIEWTHAYHFSDYTAAAAVCQMPDSGFIVAGKIYNGPVGTSMLLIRTDNAGDTLWTEQYLWEWSTQSFWINHTDDGGFIVSGNNGSGDPYSLPSYNGFLRCYASELGIRSDIPVLPSKSFTLFPPSPNPFNSSTAISFTLDQPGEVKLAVYDLLGREITRLETRDLSLGTNTVVWDASGQSSGVYFVRLMVDGRWSMARKVVLMK